MSVFDKELVINGKAVRSPEQQVWKNMKDIEALQTKIKPEYNTTAELSEASVSVALSSTNAPEGTTEGWVITQDGLKFKITGGDDTNLLLEFYCSIQGPQGEQGPSGAELEIDDANTSATKVWSSQKVAQELANAGKQYYQHNISYDRNAGGALAHYNIIEITDDGTEINTRALFKQWLLERGYTALSPRIVNGGWYYNGSNTWYGAISIWANSSNHIEIRYSTGASNQTNEDVTETSVISDQVKAL